MKTASLIALSLTLFAGAAHADRFSQRKEGGLVRLMNEDAKISVLVPPGFVAQEEMGESIAILLTSPGGEIVGVSKDPMDKDAWRADCARQGKASIETYDHHERCHVENADGSRAVHLWVEPGYAVAAASQYLTDELLTKLAVTVAKSMTYRPKTNFTLPKGFTFRDDDGTEYYADGRGHAFQLLVDETGTSDFTSAAGAVVKSGGFGQYKSFKIARVQQDARGEFAGIDVVQADGAPAAGVLARVGKDRRVWVLAIAVPSEFEIAVDLAERVADSVVARNSL